MIENAGQSTGLELVTVSRRIRMDCETPVSLFLKFGAENERSFILESAEKGAHSGRYSFIGWDPILVVSYDGTTFSTTGVLSTEEETRKPFETLKKLLKRISLVDPQEIPNARGGLVGHFSYDAIRAYEDVGARKQDVAPWFDLMLPRCLLVLDHLNHCVSIFCHEQVLKDRQSARGIAGQRLDKIINKARQFSVSNTVVPIGEDTVELDAWHSNLDQKTYCQLVREAQKHIVDGDIFQVVLSRAVRRDYQGDPFEIYRALRQINPSPYMYYLKQDQRVIVGGSPEALVTIDQGVVTTKPIAGTRWRGKTLEEDQALERDLLADKKEIAEHVMLVDLGRNDLGRIAKPGTVTVPHFKQIERFSHVMHIVSIVQAELREGLHPLDALMSAFPAGTLTGAPKIRAMQIINDFEPEGRSVYGGVIGFLDFSGNLDSCIAIRTAIFEDGQVRCQAGGGIVADSIPEMEYNETTHKLMSMITAVERALISQRRIESRW